MHVSAPIRTSHTQKVVRIAEAIKPVALPRQDQHEPRLKRRLELTQSSLAKRARLESTKTSKEIAEDLASIYNLTPGEKKIKVKQIRLARAALRSHSSEFSATSNTRSSDGVPVVGGE